MWCEDGAYRGVPLSGDVYAPVALHWLTLVDTLLIAHCDTNSLSFQYAFCCTEVCGLGSLHLHLHHLMQQCSVFEAHLSSAML